MDSVLPVLEDLNDFRLEENHVLCSLDYESMYTNVDVDETIQTIIEFYHLIGTTTAVPCAIFVRCVLFYARDATYFGAVGTILKQVKGLDMGNQLAQVLAEIRTDHVLINTLHDVDASIVSFLYKYVDDIFTSIHRNHVSNICDLLSKASNMNTTVEHENDANEVVFLDCTFKRIANQMVVNKWFIKQCSSMKTLNYHSHHPWHVKRNCAGNLVRTARLRTSPQFLTETQLKVATILRNSSYPRKTIRRLLYADEPFSNARQQSTNDIGAKVFSRFLCTNL